MTVQFESYHTLGLIYSKDLKHVLLHQSSNGLIDGWFYDNQKEKIATVDFTKMIFEKTNLKIDPNQWQIITSLSNIERKWSTDVYIAVCDFDKDTLPEHCHVTEVDNISESCRPHLRWLVPLSIDFSILGCTFNQILMK